ncbi:MAG: hypothetical protein RLZZ127_2108 [Planctomycetota bacterium]
MERVRLLLHQHGERWTTARAAVVEALMAAGDHPDAGSLLVRARERDPGASAGAVYRTLALLVDLGLVRRITGPDGAARFEWIADRARHHHLIDPDGTLHEILVPELDALLDRILAAHGRRLDGSGLDIPVLPAAGQ